MYQRLAQQLEEWEGRTGLPQAWVALWRHILSVQEEIQSRLSSPALSLEPAVASDRLVQGQPLLTFRDLRLDWTLLCWAMEKIAEVMGGEIGEKVAIRLRLLTQDGAALRRAVRAFYNLSPSLGRLAEQGGVPAPVLAFVLGVALQPVLRAHAQVAAAWVKQELWRRGNCPVCGGAPDLAYLTADTRARWLVCSRCESEWLFQRLGCPYCGNDEQNSLAYYASDSSPYRLYVCDRCRCYLKCVNLESLPQGSSLALERLISYRVDAQARQLGYRPPGLPPNFGDGPADSG